MDLSDQLGALAARAAKQLEHLTTEEATKTALVLPFLHALGYNIFDPTEVVPEFTADHGTKKGEKVDYAIKKNGEPIILIECKKAGAPLTNVAPNQLFRYFAVTPVRVGILTDGIRYLFFSDLEQSNKMDDRPFLEINLMSLSEPMVRELKRFAKGSFDLDSTLEAAVELKYTRAIKRVLAAEFEQPSEALVKHLVGQVYDGRMTQAVKDQFAEITRRALFQFLNDAINERLKTALVPEETPRQAAPDAPAAADGEPPAESDIETTAEEMDAFLIVRAIVRDLVDVKRVTMRDTKSYCGVLLDDNNRKPICRLRFNASSKKYLGVFDTEKNETKLPIDSLDDLYRHAEAIRTAVRVHVAAV